MQPILYLTSELVNRDWDSRLLMADHAVKAGFSVVIGQQWAILNNAAVIPRGMFLFKTMNMIQGGAMSGVKKFGHAVASMDEESLPLAIDGDEATDVIVKAYSAPAIDSSDIFFANSPLHFATLQKSIPNLAAKAQVTGSARVDLLSPQLRTRFAAQAKEIRDKIGPFILFNSNTASRNSIWNRDQFLQIQVRLGALDVNNPASVALFQEQLDCEEENAAAFEGLLKWCAANASSHTIVVRPHPSEGLDYWTKFSAESPRVRVEWNTPHVPWMLASDLVVHTNCTTGVEAALLGRPTLNLNPRPNSYWSKIYFAHKISTTFNTVPDATNALSEFLATGKGSLVQNEAQRQSLLNYYPFIPACQSAQNIAMKMTSLLIERGAQLGSAPGPDAFKGNYRYQKHEGTLKKKFYKTPQDAVNDFKAMRAASGLNHPVSFSQIDDSLFLLQPA